MIYRLPLNKEYHVNVKDSTLLILKYLNNFRFQAEDEDQKEYTRPEWSEISVTK